ncbi:MAG: hypothetical protein FWG85_04380 [Bacteroidetes bacterium]|nr:hypothetical protein [Bacteroidota bacterium]
METTVTSQENPQTALANVQPLTTILSNLRTCLNAIVPSAANQFKTGTAEAGETIGYTGVGVRRIPRWSDANVNQAALIMNELSNTPQNQPIFDAAGVSMSELNSLTNNIEATSDMMVVAQEIVNTLRNVRLVANASIKVEFNRLYATARGAAKNGSAVGINMYNSLRVMYPHAAGPKSTNAKNVYAERSRKIEKAAGDLRAAGINLIGTEGGDC